MGSEGMLVRTGRAREALYVACVAAAVGIIGSIVTSSLAFAVSVILSAGLGFGTLAYASTKGRTAVASGEMTKAGALAGGLLVIRLLGIATLMVLASLFPSLLNMWGVLTGFIAADATLVFFEWSSFRTAT